MTFSRSCWLILLLVGFSQSLLLSQQTLLLEQFGFVSSVSTGEGTAQPFIRIPADWEAVGLTASQTNSAPVVFVLSYCPPKDGCAGRLDEYSLSGSVVNSWAFNEKYSNIVVDPEARYAYLVTTFGNYVYRLALQQIPQAQPERRASIPNAGRLGPLALDFKKQRIFVADVLRGTLYQSDLAASSFTEIAEGLGEPLALSFDAEAERIYVCDAIGRRIVYVTLDHKPSLVSAFGLEAGLKDPSTLVVSPDSTIWVGDRTARVVAIFSRNGQLVRRLAIAAVSMSIVKTPQPPAGELALSPCDINRDGSVNILDVQLIINQTLGASAAISDLNGDGKVDKADVAIVVSASLGGGCKAVVGPRAPAPPTDLKVVVH